MNISSLDHIAVVIVNWERPTDSVECIQSVLASGTSPEQVLLVDNGSQDVSVEVILRACPRIHLLTLPRNQGFAGGYNTGIKQALASGAEKIFLLNNDTIVEPQTIHALSQADWDVAIPKILFHDCPQLIWSAGARWRLFPPSVVMIGYRHPDGSHYDRPHQLRYATGCALMGKRHVFEALGGFDPEFENYMEDYDLFYRIGAAGYKTGYVPSSRVLHKVSQTLGFSSPLRWRYLGRNTVLFYRKEDRFPSWMLWSYLGWFLLRELLKGQVRFLPAFWDGVRQGFDWVREQKRGSLGTRPL
jgi:GT2 family glycosyltransferase